MEVGALLNPITCIGWIIVGAIAGAVARSLMKDSNQPFILDVVLGLIGAAIGGFIANLLGFGRPDGGIELVIVNLIFAIIGAIIVIGIVRLVRRSSSAV